MFPAKVDKYDDLARLSQLRGRTCRLPMAIEPARAIQCCEAELVAYLNLGDIKVLVIPARFRRESSAFMLCRRVLHEVCCWIPD